MASQTKITVTYDKDATIDIQQRLLTSAFSKINQVNSLQNELNRIAGAVSNATVATVIDDGNAVSATGTITLSGINTANDTILINGSTLTAVASGATGTQFNVGTTAATQAANIASAINAATNALINAQVTASALGAVVTITSAIPGVAGNAVTIAKGTDAGSVMTVSGARLTGGSAATNGSSVSYAFGL